MNLELATYDTWPANKHLLMQIKLSTHFTSLLHRLEVDKTVVLYYNTLMLEEKKTYETKENMYGKEFTFYPPLTAQA